MSGVILRVAIAEGKAVAVKVFIEIVGLVMVAALVNVLEGKVALVFVGAAVVGITVKALVIVLEGSAVLVLVGTAV